MENNNHHIPSETTEETRSPFDAFLHHQKRALEETNKALEALIPPGVKEHGAEAGREFVKGFKVLLDAAITELEKASKEIDKRQTDEGNDRPSSTGPAKVRVQVE